MSCQIRQNLCIRNLEKRQGPQDQAETARASERRRATQSLRERLCAGCRNETRRSPNSSEGSSRLSLPAAQDPPSQLLRRASSQQQQPRHFKAERPLAENCAAEDSRLPCDKISFSSSGLVLQTLRSMWFLPQIMHPNTSRRADLSTSSPETVSINAGGRGGDDGCTTYCCRREPWAAMRGFSTCPRGWSQVSNGKRTAACALI